MPDRADLEWALEDVRARAPKLKMYVDYYAGRHRLLFASAKFKDTFGDLFREFADNMCDEVVDGISDRFQLLSWSANDDTLNKRADDLWEYSRGDSRLGATIKHGFREGDGFTIVQQDERGRYRAYDQDPAQIAVRYSVSIPDQVELVAKVWRDGRRYRVNLYYPDRWEKYASRGLSNDGGVPKASAFQLLESTDKDNDDAGPVTDPDVEGVIPVFHYPNGSPGDYGQSLLHGVIPLQDAFNKSIADMLVTMEAHAAPQRWARGIEPRLDPITGREVDPFKDAHVPGSIVHTGSKDAMFGQFDPASLDAFLSVQDQFKLDIVYKGKLPPYAATFRSGSSALPSGVALLVLEGRTTKLVRDRHRDWGHELRREHAYAVSLDAGITVEPGDLEDQWAPAETRDEKALLETLIMKKDLGVPETKLLSEAGYDQDDIDKWLEAAGEREVDEATALSVLQGGRTSPVSLNGARTLGAELGIQTPPTA